VNPVRTTEMSTLTTCEKKWHYRYALDIPEPEVARPLTLGTLFHALWAQWWEGKGDMDPSAIMERIPEDRREHITEDILSDAWWMLGRYDTLYGPTRDEWEMVENEIEMEATVAGVLMQGRADGMFHHKPTGKLFLGECKTMKDWRRLDILTVDPQVTHYYTLAQATGRDVFGVMYDAAKTYRWKRDEAKHPPHESFQRLLIDRTVEQCNEAVHELTAFADRREDLLTNVRLPLRNVSSMTCSWCAYKGKCWEELAFPEPTIEWDGDDA
jgi:PD-(D/E)XK nuclease superfamily